MFQRGSRTAAMLPWPPSVPKLWANSPPDLIDWLGQLPTFYEDEHRYYVHAGVHPLRSLADQNDQDRLWIREPFPETEHDFGKHIVHGHTPLRTDSPDERPYRTNLDTAAVYGGALTAGVFTSGQTHAVAYLRVLATQDA
jgi:serine/threonine protein phosphatase 1